MMSDEDREHLHLCETHARMQVRRILPTQEIDDIIQDAYLRLCASGHDLAEGDTQGLLRVTAYRIAVDQIRKQEVRSNMRLGGHLFQEVIDERMDPQRACLALQELECVVEFAKTLSPRRQQAFVLTQILGYSNLQAAREMGISVTGIEQNLRAVRQLCRHSHLWEHYEHSQPPHVRPGCPRPEPRPTGDLLLSAEPPDPFCG